MGTLPAGIVAFLMTDVVASTEAWNVAAVEMGAALEALDAHITAVVRSHEGSVIKARGEGDSHFAAFDLSSAAISAAAAVQTCPDRRLSVRACVLVGEAQPQGGDYVGAVVNLGARIRSVAHGGQVVVTSPAADLASSHLRDELTLRTLGQHRVRDFPTPMELFQLHGPGLRSSFPPLRTPAFASSVMMAVVSVDEVRSTCRLGKSDEQLIAWQRELIHSMRELSDAHDGRHLKILGDGCLVAFEDPRAAMAFASSIREAAPVRTGIALGLVEDIEGEISGRTVFTAHALMKEAGAAEIRCCPIMEAVCPPTLR
jgi:class 3 adenylate cyclase